MKRHALGFSPMRAASGLLLAPLLVPAVYYLGELWAGPALEHVEKYRGIALAVVLMSYVATLVLGALVMAVLLAIRRLTGPYLLSGGFLAGALACLPIVLGSPLPAAVTIPGLAGLCGLLTSAVFVVVAGVAWKRAQLIPDG